MGPGAIFSGGRGRFSRWARGGVFLLAAGATGAWAQPLAVYTTTTDLADLARQVGGDRVRALREAGGKAAAVETVKQDGLREDAGAMIQATFGKLSFMPKLQIMLDQASIPWSAPKMIANLSAAAVILSCGGEEERAIDLLHEAHRAGINGPLVVGAAEDHRLAVELMRRGAGG